MVSSVNLFRASSHLTRRPTGLQSEAPGTCSSMSSLTAHRGLSKEEMFSRQAGRMWEVQGNAADTAQEKRHQMSVWKIQMLCTWKSDVWKRWVWKLRYGRGGMTVLIVPAYFHQPTHTPIPTTPSQACRTIQGTASENTLDVGMCTPVNDMSFSCHECLCSNHCFGLTFPADRRR
jgi:hypothetical protein